MRTKHLLPFAQPSAIRRRPSVSPARSLRVRGLWLPLLAALLLPAVGWLSPAARAASDDYYIHPPGCLWSTLLETNATVKGLAPYPGGVVLAANLVAPVGPDLDNWGLLYKLNGDSGAVLLTTNFHGEAVQNEIHAIIPVTSGGGTVEAMAFTGHKYYSSPPWSAPWVWLVKTDLNLVKQTEAHVGIVSHTGQGFALAQEPSGFVVGGCDAYLSGGSYGSWFGRFDAALNLIGQTNISGGCEGVSGVAQAPGGGYVLSAGNMNPLNPDCDSVTKINASLGFEWRAADVPPGPGCERDHYFRIRPVADGWVALGRRVCAGASPALLTRFAADGSVVWSRENLNGAGQDLVLTPDGGVLVVGSSATRRLDDVPCLWLLKTDALGGPSWEMCLGGNRGASGAAAAVAADGNYAVAGNAVLADGSRRMWVLIVDASQQAPLPVFTVAPASPVFRSQEVTFDATASTAPGSAIAAYEWDFGDGTTGTGAIVRHTYNAPGTNTVTLTVVNTNSVLASTSQPVVVVGLAIQWERFHGDGHGAADDDIGYSLVEARDGGFVVAGGTGGNYTSDHRFWAFKTDARGRQVWSRTLVDSNRNSSCAAHGVTRAHDSGYVIAATCYAYLTNFSYWFCEPWLVKLDEAGEPAWPIRVYGLPPQDETAYGVTATRDGGYMLTGYYRPAGGDLRHYWLVKTDGEGIELWNRILTNNVNSGGRSVVQTADGGHLVTGATGWDALAPPALAFKTDPTGLPLWTNSFGRGGSYEGGGRWIAETPGGGAVVVGGNRDILMLFLNSDGTAADSQSWGSPDGSDYLDNGECAAATPDGGYLIGGFMTLRNTTYWQQREVALIKTDSAGNTNWIQILPGTTNRNETAYGVVALSNSAYVVLAHREVTSGTDPNPHSVWLFKLAANHPPVPRMSFGPSPVTPGQIITFDGSASSDPDGTVVAWEWDFGDGATTNGPIVPHTYTNAGSFPVRLTVLDNAGAERTVTNWTCAAGITALSPGVTLTLAGITNAPASDPLNYPPAGAPASLDWASALGFRLGATGPNGNQAFRLAFCEAINTNFVLYRLPAWTIVPYTNVNQVAVDVSLPIAGGVLNTNLVLARAIPPCTILRCETSGASRLALTFSTDAGYRYRLLRSGQLAPPDWQPVNHAWAAGDPLTLETLEGTGVPATAFVERPMSATSFFRIQVESAAP